MHGILRSIFFLLPPNNLSERYGVRVVAIVSNGICTHNKRNRENISSNVVRNLSICGMKVMRILEHYKPNVYRGYLFREIISY